MTKIKAANLTGVQLRMAVAIADGWTLVQIGEGPFNELMIRITKDRDSQWFDQYDPTIPSGEGMTIVFRDGISLIKVGIMNWRATLDYGNSSAPQFHDENPMIAAMRCYVASKLGDEVELDAEGMLQCHA